MANIEDNISKLLCVFLVSAGQNGENLGSDEEEIISFSYLFYDKLSYKIIKVKSFYIQPKSINAHFITEECKIQTGICENDVVDGITLEEALNTFVEEIDTICNRENIAIITDGQLHFRMCLFPILNKNSISIPNILYKFFDLRKLFLTVAGCNTINSLNDMLKYINKNDDIINSNYGLQQCYKMASVIDYLLKKGVVLKNQEIIRINYICGICNKNEYFDENTILRARGLPWQTSEQDIMNFFSGLNIHKGGIALCLSNIGRRNGEALVRFESKEHRDLALRKHKHHIGHRYIELYKATKEEYINISTSDSNEAISFLTKQVNNEQIIIRMRGLPFNCLPDEVIDFFLLKPNPVEVLDGKDGILFVQQSDGKATGDAFVMFSNENDAHNALLKHRQCIGLRYIELFRSTTAEVQQVLNKFKEINNASSVIESKQVLLGQNDNCLIENETFLQYLQNNSQITDNIIILTLLPVETTVSDILLFLGEFSKFIIFQGIHLIYNLKGNQTGEALIQMDNIYHAKITAATKNKKTIFIRNKKSTINVYLYSEYYNNFENTNNFFQEFELSTHNCYDKSKTILNYDMPIQCIDICNNLQFPLFYFYT